MNYENEPRLRTIRSIAAGQNIKERDYWLSKLSGGPVKTAFPYDSMDVDGGPASASTDAFSFQLNGAVYANLVKISNKSEVRLHILLTAGWLILLNRYTGNTDIIVGVPTYRQEVEGELINTVLALRNSVTGPMTVKDLLLQVGQTILEANQNQNYPIETLIYKLNLPGTGAVDEFQLFDLSILLEGIHERSYLNRIKQNMIVSFRNTGESIEGIMEYNPQLYRGAAIRGIVSHYAAVLQSALADVNRPISQVELLSEGEKKQIVEDFNNNKVDFPRDKFIYRYVEEFACSAPDRIAVIGSTVETLRATSLQIQITYRQLNGQSDRVAGLLIEKSVLPGDIVGVMMERSIEMVVGILGIWKAGGAYMPIDPGYPQERIDYMLKDSGAKILLTAAECVFNFHHSSFIIHHSNHLSYIIYTSGTTGKPKGAMVEHIGMMNHIQAKINTLHITAKSIIAQNASHTFDISVWQFFTALVRGGTTVIYPDSLVLDPVRFIHRLSEDRVAILEVVPSYLSVMLDAFGTRQDLPLNYLLVTGEEVKPSLAARWFRKFPGIKMVNAYGPTEASDDITHFVMEGDPGMERIPLGKPVQNFDIYIVDEYMNLCPVGVKGELCVSGIGVGRGYLNRPELTAEKFIDFHHSSFDLPRIHHSNFYRTGDLARWLPDGNIEFLGRIDHQVKIRGFRIELGEIENQLARLAGIKEVVVIDRADREGKKYLCAYITGKEGKMNIPGAMELKRRLSGVLPDYMIPSHFAAMETLPLTANGKIDRKALPEPTSTARDILYIPGEMLDRLQSGSTAGKALEMKELSIHAESQAVELTEEETRRILYEFNNTAAEFPVGKTLHQLFEEQVEKTPGNIAVSGSSLLLSKQITYRELNEKSNRLAAYLWEKGVKPGDIVGVMASRSIEMIVGIYAVLKAGCAYLALSVTYPDKRLDFICRDSEMQAALTDNTRKFPVAVKNPILIDVTDENCYMGDGGNRPVELTSAAAIFYTSGSTGNPKGAVLDHAGLVNRLYWMQRTYSLDESDVILQRTPVFFDVSMWELFWWMFGGASLYILPPTQGDKPQDIVDGVKAGRVTMIHFTPTPMAPFLDFIETTGRVKEAATLKHVFASGETLTPILVNRFNRLLYAANGTRLHNLYGPTEASIDVSYFDCASDGPVEIVPIGKPIDNVRLYIVDRNIQPVPIGVVGQLCIAGVALARGYLNRPELTAEKFIKSFSGGPGGRFFKKAPLVYKTGDLARWLPNGNIEFLGRIDQQVQLNGIRIEVGEIESALLKHKDIKEAVVAAGANEKSELILCAFIVAQHDLGQSDFREALVRELPHYMVPTRFVRLEKLPLTPSGKIDRKVLGQIEFEPGQETEYVAPRTDIETRVAGIWKEILNRDKVGINDNFFDLGGNSLGIIQVNLKLKDVFKQDIPALVMFEHSTVSALAQYLEKTILSNTSAPGAGDSDVAGGEERMEVKARGKNKMRERRDKVREGRTAPEYLN
ncbi:MAG: non-ribosomal peptide synthetase [Candidatus Aminicenantes bacterium]|nr:non-ribosomal peptide synthetase [Candidatus Aminicenantes bacterium]